MLLVGTGIYLSAGPFVRRVLAAPAAQDQAPTRREFTVTARDYSFSPNRVEVQQDDLIKLTVQSADNAYGFTIDDYRVSKRVPAGGSTVVEFRADRAGTLHVLFEPEQRRSPFEDERAADRQAPLDSNRRAAAILALMGGCVWKSTWTSRDGSSSARFWAASRFIAAMKAGAFRVILSA